MVLSETVAYITIFSLTVVFTAFALVIQEGIWRIALKFIAGLFWLILAVEQFFFMGAGSPLIIMGLAYAVFGMVFFFAIINDSLSAKKKGIWDFDE